MSYSYIIKKYVGVKTENNALKARISELEDYISQGCCSQIEANERIIEEQQRWLELLYILKDIYDVIIQSEGVVGWHLNGAVALWDEFEFKTLIEQAIKIPEKIGKNQLQL